MTRMARAGSQKAAARGERREHLGSDSRPMSNVEGRPFDPAHRVTAAPARSLRRPSLADIFHRCAVALPRARAGGIRDAGHGTHSDKL